MKRRQTALVLHIGLLALFGCATPKQPDKPPAAKLPVRCAVVHEEPVSDLYRASGTVRGRTTTTVTSKTVGYVRKLLVRSGDYVARGQLLATLEAGDIEASVSRARASIARAEASKAEAESSHEAAQAETRVAKALLERQAQLLTTATIAQHQYDESEARYRASVAQESAARARIHAGVSSVAEARALLEQAQATLGHSSIVAPFSGRILERHVDEGALAAPGTPLFVLSEQAALRVEVPVDATRADRVKEGDPVEIELDTLSEKRLAKVAEVVPSVDVSSRAFLVKIDLPGNTEEIRPGTFARASFRLGTRSRLVVPSSAVTTFGALERVYVVANDRAQLRMVTTGETYGNWTVVLSGLSSSEQIVASPTSNLVDGALVEVQL